MLQPEHRPLNRRRKRRVYHRVLRARARALRDQLLRTRVAFSVAAALAVAALAGALALSLRPAPAPEPVLLGQGRAGVLGVSHRAPADPPAAPPTAPSDEAGEAVDSGEASYYGEELRGNATASGERFDPGALTAAHRTLPLGSRLRVTNLRTGRSVVVRVNDRGPFAPHRVLDVSERAARTLGMLESGTARVRMELLPS